MRGVSSGIDWSAPSYEELCRRHEWHIPERLNLASLCTRYADGSGRPALVDAETGRVTSFDELAALAARLHGLFREAGVERGDRVAVLLPQRLETVVAHLAAFRAGAVSMPLSPLFRAEALGYRLGHGAPKVLVTDAEGAAHLAEARAATALPPMTLLSCDAGVTGTEPLAPHLDAPAPALPAADTAADDPAMLIYTSGTSGTPKGALHAHRFVPGRLPAFELLHRLESRPSHDRPFHTPADWAWIGGLVDCVLTPLAFGCPVLAARRRRFDPEAMVTLVERHRVRSLFLPPTALRMLERAGVRAPAGVETVHTAGEPLPPETFAWAQRTFGTVLELYGLTEMGAVIGCSPFFPVRPGSMGKPYPGHEVALLDDEGRPVTDGAPGEIAVRRGDPGMFLGYHRDPAATAARFRGDLLVTGDRAFRDADGYFHYLGRADDVLNVSGHRVGPAEIEACLERHPSVERAAVVGEPDALRGTVVAAFVVPAAGAVADEALARTLSAHVRDRLAAHEVPRLVVFARELPVTTTGKLRRIELRAPDARERYGFETFRVER